MPPVVHRDALTSFVVSLSPTLRRAKGVVGLSDTPGRQWAWGYVEGDDVLRFEVLPESGFATVAVFIGVDLPEDELRRQLDGLRADPT